MLEGSDGFRHKDSLGGQCVYRGGACQFMRSGKGAMHEEFWETREYFRIRTRATFAAAL